MYNIKKVDLIDIKLSSINFYIDDNEKAQKGGSVELGSDISISAMDDNGVISLTSIFKVNGKSAQSEKLFAVKAEYNSIHQVSDIEEINKYTPEEISDYCFSLIYPTVRDDVMSLLSRAGLRQITLPFNAIKK